MLLRSAYTRLISIVGQVAIIWLGYSKSLRLQAEISGLGRKITSVYGNRFNRMTAYFFNRSKNLTH